MCKNLSSFYYLLLPIQTYCRNGPVGRLSVIRTFNKGKSMKKLFFSGCIKCFGKRLFCWCWRRGGSNGVGVGVGLGTGFGF